MDVNESAGFQLIRLIDIHQAENKVRHEVPVKSIPFGSLPKTDFFLAM